VAARQYVDRGKATSVFVVRSAVFFP